MSNPQGINQYTKGHANSVRKSGGSPSARVFQTQREHLAQRLIEVRHEGMKGQAAYAKAFERTAFNMRGVKDILKSVGAKTTTLPKLKQYSSEYGKSVKELSAVATARYLSAKRKK